MRSKDQEVARYNYLRTQDVADRLGVSRSHVIDLIHRRELKAVNVGLAKRPEYRISEQMLAEFLERRAVA